MSSVRFSLKENKYLLRIRWLLNKVKVEERKRPRDLRPLLKFTPKYHSSYQISPLHMSMVDENRQMVTSPTNCRDYLNEAIRCYVSGEKIASHHVGYEWNLDMDFNNLRIALLCDVAPSSVITIKDGIRNGVRVANLYGRVAGWGKLRLVTCRVPDSEKEKTYKECYLLIGDKNWQRTPQYISMLILLIRVCMVHEVPEWIDDAYALEGYWAEMMKYHHHNTSDVTSFLSNSYEYLITIMANDGELFPRSMFEAFEEIKGRPDNFHYGSGLYSLTSGESIHPESAKKLKQLMEAKECRRKE
jgi:hypothetical protein